MERATFQHPGDAIDAVVDRGANEGEVLVAGDLVAVARHAIAPGARGSLAVRGVFAFPKARGASTAIALGAPCSWDPQRRLVVAGGAAADLRRIGPAVAPAGDDDATVDVLLR